MSKDTRVSHDSRLSKDKRMSKGTRMSFRSTYSIQRLSLGRRICNKLKLVRTYQPTYQLNSRNKFSGDKVEKILKRIVDSELEETEYSEKVVPELCMTLAEMIRNAVKEEKYDRYRILVSVSIGQRRNQGVHVFHSFLWDYERDGFASYNYENCHLFANFIVYGVYLD